MELALKTAFELKKELKGLQPLKPVRQKALEDKFRLEFNYNSNHIEGNTLTYGETKLLLMFDKTQGNHDIREFEEMQAHDAAYKMVREWAADKDRDLTEADIRTLNEVILVKPFYKEAITPEGKPTQKFIEVGKYKMSPNSVRLENGKTFEFASVEETPVKIKELLAWYLDYESHDYYDYNAIEIAALFHYKFVRIHPFDDGNGRVARLLMNYVLLRNDYPPVVIKTSNKGNYLFALSQADAGLYDEFIKYITEQLNWSLELSIKAANGHNISEEDDIFKELKLLKVQLDKETVLNEKRTISNVGDVINYDILPMLVEIEHKCSFVEEYYFNKSRVIIINKSDIAHKSILGPNKSNLLEIVPEVVMKWKIENKTINEFNYEFKLEGFRMSNMAQNSYTSIKVKFNKFNYEIQAQDSSASRPQQRPYGVRLTHDEVKNYVNQNVKGIIEDIKRFSNK